MSRLSATMRERAASSGEASSSLPDRPEFDGRGALLAAAALAIVLACGSPLIRGIAVGWPVPRIAVYCALALVFLMLSQAQLITWPPLCRMIERLWPYLLLMGGLAWALQVLSGDPFLQPIVFTVPFVYAALSYDNARTFAVGALYIGLMVLGLLAAGLRHPAAILYPAAAYGACMALFGAFTQLSRRQTAARIRADELAAALAAERDQLAYLAQVTATLGRDVDLGAVVEQVARDGRGLAGAAAARVWLYDDGIVRLAAAVPEAAGATVAPAENGNAHGGEHVLPLVWKGERIGLLELVGNDQRSAQQEPAVLRPFADAAAAAIQNARLFEQAGQSATLAERNRLARELHDTIAQGLTALTMQLEATQRAFDRDSERAKARLARAIELARETLGDVRRSVWTLAEPLADGQALTAALRDAAQRFELRSGVAAHYHHTGAEPALGHGVATQVLRIVGEALVNVEKHAGASSVDVASELKDEVLRVVVRDDGAGFDDGALERRAQEGGFGMFSLRERARLAGGTLSVDSRPGAGTTVELSIALRAAHISENIAP